MASTPLTAEQLPPLLDILRNPENPAFNQALNRLSEFDPTTLTGSNAPFLLAEISTVLTTLAGSRTLTTEQLAKLRHSNQALQSYTTR